jgi:adenosylcobinamide amidohydrolase
MLAATALALLGPIGAVIAPAVSAQQGEQETLVSGWYRDRAVEYYDFGDNTKLGQGSNVQTAPIYVFIHGMNADGTPDMVEGQHNIVDAVPGEPGYSDLWQVTFVTVADDYVADSIKSASEITAASLEMTPTQMFVNCPIVPAGTTLETGKEVVQGWNDGEAVFYPDFGANINVAIPIYVFVTGFDAASMPQMVQGQQNIIDSVPWDAGYSAFWRVNFVTVPAGYEPNSIRSAADAEASGYPIEESDVVVNCPVTTVASTTTAPPAAGGGTAMAPPSTGTGPGGPSDPTAPYAVLAAAAIALGAVSAAGGLALSRRPR